MLAPAERAPNSRPSPLPSALLAAELGPPVMADDPCEAAFSAADPTGPRKYYRARYYDPKIGRFLSEDPIPLGQRKLEELNPYAYVANNPVNFIDPSGAQCFILGSETTVIDPYIIGGRQLPTFRLSPGQTFNEGTRPVRPTPPQSFIPKPAPPPVINPTPTQIINQMPWWWKILHPLTPWGGDPSVVPITPKEDCKCIA